MATWFLDLVEINGGFLPGLSLPLPKGLTCIIGPRGSGKSTLAEAIRLALGNSRVNSRSVRDLIDKNLANAVVTIKTAPGAEGTAYLIRRSGHQLPTLTTLAGEPVAGVSLERGGFLPLDAYSSNEIEEIADENLGDKRRSLLDDLRAVEFARVQVAVADRLRALEANRDAVRFARASVANLRERIEELADAPARLAALPPPPEGEDADQVGRSTRQVRANEQERQGLARVKQAAERSAQEVRRVAETCATDLGRTLTINPSANHQILSDFDARIATLVQSVQNHLTKAADELGTVPKVVDEYRERLAAVHSAQQAEFDRLQLRNLAASQAVQLRTVAEQAVVKLREYEGELRAEQRQLDRLLEERKELKGAYLLERERVSELRAQVAQELQVEAGEKVRVRVLRNADSLGYQQLLAEGLQGARVRNHEDIVSTLGRLRPEDLAQMIQDNDVEEFEAQTALGKERARKVLDSFRDKIDPMQLETVLIDDRVCIELNVASQFEPHFKDASELSRGQKCTALLPLLLARRDTPLVIDQPEDNLDNHFIFETVVENIRRVKRRRQLVFITHNANIPVLGEADLVVVMDSDGRTGFVKKSGSVDDCRDEIIELLEGGRRAFELRRQRYGTE